MGYMFSLYLMISLLLLAQLKEKRGKMLNVQLEMGFILWIYQSVGSGCLECSTESQSQMKSHLKRKKKKKNESYFRRLRHGNANVAGVCAMHLLTLIK